MFASASGATRRRTRGHRRGTRPDAEHVQNGVAERANEVDRRQRVDEHDERHSHRDVGGRGAGRLLKAHQNLHGNGGPRGAEQRSDCLKWILRRYGRNEQVLITYSKQKSD